jgi:ankyrin repeat protein
MYKAVYTGDLKRTANLLKKPGASLNSSLDPEHDWFTPLRSACELGHTRLARMLLYKGAQTGKEDPDGCNELYIACENGHEAVAALLVDRGAAVDARAKAGATPLHIAAKAGHTEVGKILLDRGASLDLAAKDGACRCMWPRGTATQSSPLCWWTVERA